MDSFIEWLVILFFIVSFLNSILKPKKKSQKGTPAGSSERVITSGPTVDAPDLSRDVEEAIRQKMREVQKKKVSPKVQSQFDKRYSEQKIFDTKTKKEQRKAESALDKLSSVLPPLDEVVPGGKISNIYVENAIKALRNPESARNAILLSEILGKPKALKKKW